ncbi:MAG: zf-HC2 domain-containing protein [Pseudomonadales bacterium]|nr:zf-HC2 domain-containing protein [Pseudomonadales bacterium]
MQSTDLNCERCQELLFDFHEGRLDSEYTARVDRHLKTCNECSAFLNDIWQMGLVATRWQDQHPANYDRGRTADYQQQGWRFSEVLATAASILAIVLVLTDASIDTSNGVVLKFGSDEYVSEQTFAVYQAEQADRWDERLDELTARQVASDQLVLRSVLQASRQERKQELTTLVNYWNTTQAQQYRETEEHLRFLLTSQAEDEKDIRQLSNAFHQISSNM